MDVERLQPAVPVEHRLFGLDRRLFWPTGAVFCVVLLWSVIMPAIDAVVPDQVVQTGTVYDVGPARFTPAPGWLLAKPPSPVGESTSAAVFKDGVTLRVSAGRWGGTADELLAQLARTESEFVVEGQAIPIVTSANVSGVFKKISGPDFVGMLAVFVDAHGHGVQVIARGPVTASLEVAQPVAEMIRSVQFESQEEN